MAEPKIIQKEEKETKEVEKAAILEIPAESRLQSNRGSPDSIEDSRRSRSSIPMELESGPVLEEAKSEKEILARLDSDSRLRTGTFDEQGKQVEEFEQKVLDIARVTRVTKGGKRFTFRAAIIIGNKNGKVGFGMGKGNDVAQAVEKAFKQAKKSLINVVFSAYGGSAEGGKGETIPHEVEAKVNSAVVFLKPAAKGSGVRAGGALRVIAKLAGIQDISGKIISRTNNKINIAKATIEALKKLKGKIFF